MPAASLAFANSRPDDQRGRLSKDQLLGKSTQHENKHQQLLEWHGVQSIISGGEFIGDCPFYDCPSFIDNKSGKFSMNRQTGQWQCFVCQKKGNVYDFIRSIHQNWLEQTTPHQLNLLRELRQGAVDVVDLTDMQVVLNSTTGEWALPAWNSEGKIVNLYVWKKHFDAASGKELRQLYSSPGHNQLPYGLNRLRSGTQRSIWVVEGHWDYLAIAGLFRRLDLLQKYDLIAAPGADNFPTKYLSIFNGRSVVLVYDNDQTGAGGMDRLLSRMSQNFIMPLDVRCISWPSGLPKGFDVSDAITHLPPGLWKKAAKA